MRAASRKRRREAAHGLLFVSPQLIGFTALVLGPVLAVWWYAFQDWDIIRGSFDYAGVTNFSQLLSDPVLPTVASASFLFAAGYVPLNLILGLSTAYGINRVSVAKGLFRTIYFLPVVVSAVAWTLVWRVLLQDNGAINGFLSALGFEGTSWLRERWTAIGAVVVVQALKDVGVSMVMFLAALQSVPSELEEAAQVDGAGAWTVFRRVTLPMISPFIFLVVILSIISTVKSFALIFLLTGGGPGADTTTIPFYIYQQGFQRFDMGYASALATVLFVIVLALTVGQFSVRRRWVFYED